MLVVKAIRAWVGSVAASAGMWALWVAGMHLLTGRTDHLVHNAADVSLAFGGTFALTAALVYIPAFSLIESLRRNALNRYATVAVGVALSPSAYVALAWRFREAPDPQTLGGWVVYWAGHIPGVVLGVLPFAIAGAVFGWLWRGQVPKLGRSPRC